MGDPRINWGAIGLFMAIVAGYLAVHAWMAWRERRKRKVKRGFRTMKSAAQRQRERSKKGNWRR